MKAKSRKRLLLSSVAMLLVAVLALGTATFAWFSSSDTAKATTQVKATAPAGLELCAVQAGASKPAANAGWGSILDLSAFLSAPLEPVSFNTSGSSANFNIYQTTMTSDGVVSAITGTEANTAGGQKIKNLVAIDIYGRFTGDGTKAVNFNLALPSPKSDGNAMRCAVYSVVSSTSTAMTNKRVYHLGNSNTLGANYRSSYPLISAKSGLNIDTSSSNFTIPYNNTTASYVYSSANNAASASSQGALTLANNVTSSGVLLGRFLFWVDGQDPDCKDANKANLISGTGNFTLNFTLA